MAAKQDNETAQDSSILVTAAKAIGAAAGKVAAVTGKVAAKVEAAAPVAKEGLYKAEYIGSGTFLITKPKRKSAKQRQSRLKGTVRGARK